MNRRGLLLERPSSILSAWLGGGVVHFIYLTPRCLYMYRLCKGALRVAATHNWVHMSNLSLSLASSQFSKVGSYPELRQMQNIRCKKEWQLNFAEIAPTPSPHARQISPRLCRVCSSSQSFANSAQISDLGSAGQGRAYNWNYQRPVQQQQVLFLFLFPSLSKVTCIYIAWAASCLQVACIREWLVGWLVGWLGSTLGPHYMTLWVELKVQYTVYSSNLWNACS